LFKFQAFEVIVKPKRTAFSWDTNINESTITEIKKAIIGNWPDIDDVVEATLTIARDTHSSTVIDDSGLQKTLAIMAKAGTKAFTVSLDMRMYI
jgi:hypothetical protein